MTKLAASTMAERLNEPRPANSHILCTILTESAPRAAGILCVGPETLYKECSHGTHPGQAITPGQAEQKMASGSTPTLAHNAACQQVPGMLANPRGDKVASAAEL